MITSKTQPTRPQEPEPVTQPALPEKRSVTIEEVENNPLEEVYQAVRRTLEGVMDPDSPMEQLFRTVKVDNGQFERIVRAKQNDEYAVAFPAAFVRFVNVRFLVAQQRIGEGRATMRIRYVLNDLNNSDDIVETRGFRVFQTINTAIQDAKNTEPALNERCNLTYFDMLESLDNGVQPYWVDYEIWFRDTSSFQYRNWVERRLVMPPFTDHRDAPQYDEEGHGGHPEHTYDEASGFAESGGEPAETE
jgi:hypothetical protein